MFETTEFLLQLKKVKKAKKHEFILQQRPKSSGEGSSVSLPIPDGLKGSSSSSSSDSDDKIEDISSDDDNKAAKEKVADEKAGDDQAIYKQDERKPADQRPPLVDTTMTLILETTLSPKQPPQSRRKNKKALLKKSKKPETQIDIEVLDNILTRREKKVEAMSKSNLTEAIDKSVQAHLKKTLPKDVPDFGKIKSEKAAKKKMPMYSTTSFNEDCLEEYDQKEKLLKLMRKSKSYNKHPAHRALYDAHMQSLIVNEDDMDKQLDEQSTMKKRCRDDNDQDPFGDSQKEKNKRKQKDFEFSKKDKDQVGSSKKGKSPSKSSKADKSMNVEETINDLEMDDGESVEEVVVDTGDPSQADTSVPKRDTSTWFNTVVVKRSESPNPEWHKEPTINDAPKQTWFNEMENAEKDPLMFDDVNTKGDIISHDFSKPLPLHSAPGRLPILVDFFFNKDLNYLTTGNVEEKNYATSLTKPKATRYDLDGIKEMIPKLWSLSKVAYDKDAAFGICHWDLNVNSSIEKDKLFNPELVVRRANQKEYTFKDADFPRLHLNDIEDMYLLIVIQKRVEDIQLRVESYQTKLNIRMPQGRCTGLDNKEPYTIFYEPRGVVYLNKDDNKYLMRADEVYKFGVRTLKKVCDKLDHILHNFELGYNDGMPKRAWTEKDKKQTTSMLEKIEKTLLTRWIMRSLECFVGGRKIKLDYRLLTRTK
ncbi:hypothetical protein Tco_0820741 [Tanacetum coccineum]|uniref:Uncharacterized protein n=1 Tax=Tanacetum coccineum TaxID=301880 RepID=A0ABQ5AD87_9ASTR